MKALKDIFKSISLDLGRGRMIQATDGIVEALKALEARVEAIEARNREKDCICQKTDANGEFEIVKRTRKTKPKETEEKVLK